MKIKRKALFTSLTTIAILLVPSIAFAAPKPLPITEYVGYDISYPQCGKRLPYDHYFGIVGINGGNAATANPCVADQLVWASKANNGSNQSKYQVYVNTANPGQVISQITTWPTTAEDSNGYTPNNPYGDCNGDNNPACSWLYGWNRSLYSEAVFKNAATAKGLNVNTADYTWWLDVEKMNTWQTGSSDALLRNTAAIEGFGAYYEYKGAHIGLYSTASQWSDITGNAVSSTSNLNGLPNWRPSGASLSNAKINCNVASLTPGGTIVLTQYVMRNLDYNHSCL